MIEVLNLARWEWFKLQRRWLPWILLVLLIAISQLTVWPVLSRNSFTEILYQSLDNVQTIVLLLLVVLTASVLGLEYGLGTLRPALARGKRRWQYLSGKLVMLAALTAAAMMLVLLATTVTSAIYLLSDGGTTIQGAQHGWLDILSRFGRGWLGLMPYLTLVTLATLGTRSTAAGNAIGMSYFFGEQIISLILSALLDWFHQVTDFLLVSNIASFTGGASLNNIGAPGDPSLVRPLLVLLVYTAALGALAFWLFNRRDITGASGS